MASETTIWNLRKGKKLSVVLACRICFTVPGGDWGRRNAFSTRHRACAGSTGCPNWILYLEVLKNVGVVWRCSTCDTNNQCWVQVVWLAIAQKVEPNQCWMQVMVGCVAVGWSLRHPWTMVGPVPPRPDTFCKGCHPSDFPRQGTWSRGDHDENAQMLSWSYGCPI